MLIEISLIQTLKSLKLSLNDWLTLKCLHEELNWHEELKIPLEEIYRKLVRTGYINANLVLTPQGVSFLENKTVVQEPKVTRAKILGLGDFSEFWDTFPRSDSYAHHQQTRLLRVDKPRAALYYNRIIAEHKINHEQLLNCLKKDVEMRQRASLKGQNEFKYMPGITSWLNKRYFEPYLNESLVSDLPKQTGYGEDIE